MLKESSAINDVYYNAKDKTLSVRFRHTPGVYEYKDVPAKVYNDLTHAESLGKFINSEVKNKYFFVKKAK